MEAQPDPSKSAALEELLRSNGLTAETRLYRHTLPEFLGSPDEAGWVRISSNPTPTEAVVDVYANGHIAQAETVGAGLAFSESEGDEWREDGRTRVEVRLEDVLGQGGLLYPVESVITSRTWYATLPAGDVRVRVCS